MRLHNRILTYISMRIDNVERLTHLNLLYAIIHASYLLLRGNLIPTTDKRSIPIAALQIFDKN